MASLNSNRSQHHDSGGIYIHFPFCVTRCDYCSFVSYIHDRAVAKRYIDTLKSELSLWAELYGKHSNAGSKVFDSIYIGGGTPSIAEADDWNVILGFVHDRFLIMPEAEITIEANPGTFDSARARDWRNIGINRISLGAQSFVDSELISMGRIHNSDDIIRSVNSLKKANFSNLSMDLLVGYPDQSIESVAESLRKVFLCDPCHVSVYLLEIKSGAAICESLRTGLMKLLDDDLSADMYELVCDMMFRHGFEQYEISNFCRDSHDSVHNMKYWTDGFYLGVGAGAHGRLENLRYSNYCAIEDYQACVEEGRNPWETTINLDPHTRMIEALIMGLRLNRGVDLIGLSDRYSIDVGAYVMNRLATLNMYGLFEVDERTLRLTQHGRLLSNVVFERLL